MVCKEKVQPENRSLSPILTVTRCTLMVLRSGTVVIWVVSPIVDALTLGVSGHRSLRDDGLAHSNGDGIGSIPPAR